MRFWLAIGAVALGSLTTLQASDAGGLIWTGGFLVGGALLWRALEAYRRSLSLGASPMNWRGWTAVVSGALLAAGAAFGAGLAYLDYQEVVVDIDAVGSCWANRPGEWLEAVSCEGTEADLIAVAEAADPDACPLESDVFVDGRPGYVLCLVDR